MSKFQKFIGMVLLLVAFGLLIPGITEPILVLHGKIDKAELVEFGKQILADDPDVPTFVVSLTEKLIDELKIEGELEAFSKSRSIVGTVEELFKSGNPLVAFLISLFSIVIPAIKLVLLFYSSLVAKSGAPPWIDNFQKAIGKWSMADVFVIAIMVAYLAAVASKDMEELFTLEAEFSTGFYYFLGYCLLSIFASQLLTARKTETPATNIVPPSP
ncbi:MAG: paraquat-inducible protein A [Gammaproteobacteria bacterium]|nr:MAG: paraquat-inducible protein A [Gammaproteobacteria bacterium]